MLVAYAAYLVFQLKSQKDLYIPLTEEENQNGDRDNDNNDGGYDEAPEISKWESIVWFLIMTAWISFLSEYLGDAVQCRRITIHVFWSIHEKLSLDGCLFCREP
ncbi:hypothetical protein Ddye_014366 [Dipteronia dyeriana]|uniref:Uncharacterized protein n=1 Tax=Dipteronia dyeriana TaxID=168575 RepID=A0AAD9X7W2_9ROSI|nr:hypothetical protein Ddye_014366 [Dipteronia dyeriana]